MIGGRIALIALVLSLVPRFLGERPSELENPVTPKRDVYRPEDQLLLRLIGQGRFEEALDRGRDGIQTYPTECVPYQLVVKAAAGRGELVQLTAELQEMHRKNPNDVFVPAGIALAFRELRQKERALEYFESSVQRNVPCVVVYRSYVELSQELGRTDVAEATLGQLLAERPHDAFLLFAYAYLWTRRGEALPARDRYQNAILKGPPLLPTHLHLGRLLTTMGNYEQAVSVCRVGLKVAGNGNHPEDRVKLYSTLGSALSLLGQDEESRKAFDAGLKVARTHHLAAAAASILLEQAILLGARGESSESRIYLERAQALEQNVTFPLDRAIYLQVLGRALAGLGRLNAAEDAFRECVRLAREERDPMVELDGRLNLGLLLLRRGERQAAIDAFSDAMQKAKYLGNAQHLSRALSGLASADERVGDYYRALQNYHLSLDMAEKAGGRRAQALALSNIGLVYFRLGAPAQALMYSTHAAELARNLGELRLEVSIQQGIAAAFAGLGNFQQSERIYRAALDGASRLSSPGLHALILAGWARVALELGKDREARDGFERALALARSVDNTLVHLQALSGLGHCAWRRNDLEVATKRFEEALKLIEATRESIRTGDERMSYQETRAQVYSSLAAVLMGRDGLQQMADYRRKALDVVERSRSRVLLDILASAGVPHGDGLSRGSAIGSSRTTNLELLQSRVLQEGEILLEFLLGEPESFLWAITREECHVVSLPSRREIEKKTLSFLTTVQNPPRSPGNPFERHIQLAKELFVSLVGPVGNLIAESSRVIVSPDGVLHSLPFESLVVNGGRKPGRYLLEMVPISYVPSASVLGELVQRTRSPRPELDFLGVAHSGASRAGGRFSPNPTQGPLSPMSLAPIPFAVEEVKSVARLFPTERCRTYLGEHATERAFKAENLRHFRIIHFAAHALANDIHPERSAIFLGADGSSEDDGILWMGEVLRLRLASDLVVLSGCQTGLGQVLNAEGTVGLSWAFLSAGSSSVVVSLWNVSDRSTSELMQAFYQQMGRGVGRAEALRRAKQTVLRSERKAFRHPYFWAPFVLIGQSN